MNDDRRGSDSSGAVPVIAGFALGAIIGAGLALLFAPKTGEDMRASLGDGAKKLRHDAMDKLDQARDSVTELGASTRSAIDAGREAFQHDGNKRDGRQVARTSSQAPTTPA